MDDALLKQLITGNHILDVWNHITGNAVTIVYGQGGYRRRMLIGVERKGSIRSGKFYRAATVLCEIDGIQKYWASQGESPEEAVAFVWVEAQSELLHALNNGLDVEPVSAIDSEVPDGPYCVAWQHQEDTNT